MKKKTKNLKPAKHNKSYNPIPPVLDAKKQKGEALHIEKKLIFFAYQGRHDGCADDNVESIKYAIEHFNKYQHTYLAKSWEGYRKTTTISHEILQAIDSCEIFVCDLTYFNHNVLFELGYAIGKKKNILILLNDSIAGAKERYSTFILRDIRYTTFKNASPIQGALQQKSYEKDLISKFFNLENIYKTNNDVFYKQSKVSTQASLDLTQEINNFVGKNNAKLVSDDTSEVAYKPLTWYFQNLITSKNVIIHFLGKNIEEETIENAKNSFYAGIAKGFGAEVLLVAPSKYKAPLDYHEILIQYLQSADLVQAVNDWLTKRIRMPVKQVQIAKTTQAVPVLAPISKPSFEEEHELNMLKLGIGGDIAENEKVNLLNYFVITSSYQAALINEKSLLVGRKGSGKSAIYIKLLDVFQADILNYAISLLPESDELLEDVEMSELYDSPASKRSFFFTVWKLVIYSKLADVIYERLLGKPIEYQYNKFENELVSFIDKNRDFIKLNFFGVVKEISKKLKDSRHIERPEILEGLYTEYLSPLISTVKGYFNSISAKYNKIVILADNLDKTWDSTHNLDNQCEMIATLLEVDKKIQKDLTDKSGKIINVREIIFLREDIFNYICPKSNEPDKLQTLVHKINWENYPQLLRSLVDSRFKFIIGLKDGEVEKKAWEEFFDLGKKEKKHPYEVIESIVTHRPRDIIYFISRLIESAIDKRHEKVNQQDLDYAIESYINFLNDNLIAETRAEFPEISKILVQLHKYRGEKLKYKEFCSILKDVGYNSSRIEELVSTLFENGYMVGYDENTSKPFSDIEELKRKLNERRWIFFQNEVYVIAHAKYYYIKNKSRSPF